MSSNNYNKYRKNKEIDQLGMGHFDDMINRAFNDDFFSDPFDDFRGVGNRRFNSMLGSGGHDEFFGGMDNGLMGNFGRFNSGGGNQGTVITSSYVSTTKFDNNGNPVKKEFTSQGINQYNKDGTKISEKQQNYRDSEMGIKKVSHQRTLNDVGQKIVKTKDYKNNKEQEDHYLHGLQERKITFNILLIISFLINIDELDEFNKKYNDHHQKSNFNNNYKMLDDFKARQQYHNKQIGDNKGSNMNRQGNENRGGNYTYSKNPQALPSNNNYNK